MNSDYINCIKGIESKSYLELGVGNRKSFNAVRAMNKLSVDTNGKGDLRCTTDEFFANNKEFAADIVLIDADHSAAQVLKDYNNSLWVAREWIVIHDLIPPSAKHTLPRLCGDGYKFLYTLLQYGNLNSAVYPMSENYGITFIKMPYLSISEIEDVTYDEFMNFINPMSRLYSISEIGGVLA